MEIAVIKAWCESNYDGDTIEFWRGFVKEANIYITANGNTKEAKQEIAELAEYYETYEERKAFDGWM